MWPSDGRRPAWTAVAALVLLATSGCSLWQRRYTPRTLPGKLQAQPIHSAQLIDVSRFAGPAAGNDRIDRGDVLKISLAAGLDGEAVAEFSVRVGDDGRGVLPEIGPLPLAGLTLPQAEQQITAACLRGNLYRHPLVTVAMQQQRVNRVTVTGAVEEPGVVELPCQASYLMDALVAAGGFSDEAGTKVRIRRPAGQRRLARPRDATGVQPAGYAEQASAREPLSVCLDLSDERIGATGRGEYLDDGSVVTVERLQPAPIQVVGLVNKPGQYDFPVDHEPNVYGAIAMAGGLSSKLTDEVLVLRQQPDADGLTTVRISLKAMKKDAAENLRLAPGDIVSVEPSAASVVVEFIRLLHFNVGSSVPIF